MGFAIALVVLIVILSTRNNRRNRLPGNGYNRGYIDYDRNMDYRGNVPDRNRFTQQPGFAQQGGMPFVNGEGEDIVIDNGMGKLTRYLQSSHLRSLKIDNGLGTCIVYYDNVRMDQFGSTLLVDNGMGSVAVYIPPFYRFQMSQSNGLGSINIHGNPSMDPNDPLISAEVKNGMGKVDFYFG